MSVHRALAPAKINLGLFVGAARPGDGRHELVSVMQSISLADDLTLSDAAAGTGEDQISCPGLPLAQEDNLALRALRMFRAATGWQQRPQLLAIDKRIPVAAGLGGGSADAAAALRLAAHASGLGDERLLLGIAGELGADVPAQIRPGRWLATGAGEELEALPTPVSPLGVLVLPVAAKLSTADVYREADRRGIRRTTAELERLRRRLRAELARGAPLPGDHELLENDLEPAALALCPQLPDALERARSAGVERVLLSGSGPTALGLFSLAEEPTGRTPGFGEPAASLLAGTTPPPIWAMSVDASFGVPITL
jgi:4-diphosphocytidyl-2-C-methyl-D-erythritol kinase